MKHFLIRLATLSAGVFLYAVGIVFTLRANIGYPSWDVLHAGLSRVTGINFGVMSIIVGAALGVIVTIMGEKFGLGLVFNMVGTGLFIDLILHADIIPLAGNWIVGILMLLGGLVIISLATYYYIKSAFGAGPRDNLMVVMLRKTKLPVGLCRVIIEVTVTLAGWALGGMVGIGTVVSAVTIGFFIQMTFRLFQFDPTTVRHETLHDTYRFLTGLKRGTPPEHAPSPAGESPDPDGAPPVNGGTAGEPALGESD